MPDLWALDRGAQLLSDNSVRFTLWAPHLEHPQIRVCSGPARGDHPLTPVPDSRGIFTVTVPGVGANADYGIVMGDGRLLPDPVSRWQPDGVHAPSRVLDQADFNWSDDTWRGVAMDELVIYELHVATFTPAGTFAEIIPHLAHLRSLGITAIELMPVGQFPGTRNWGYDGVGIYAVQASYGGPHGLQRLVDAAHAAGLAVLLDVVYNHLGPEGNYLAAFGPYFTHKYTTPWGHALNFDDADSDEVRRFVIDNALFWVTNYHIDGLRLDSIHGIFDFSARHVIEELASAVHDQADRLGRSVVVIAESDLNDPKVVRAPAEHGFGLDAQWSDDFHHALHAMLTGERNGYYADFGNVRAVADALREPFALAGKYSIFRRRRHGAPSVGIPRRRFVVTSQNHDQVGNRAAGDRLSTLVGPDRLRLAAALLLLSPYVPLLFMGEEYGETNPFQYFIDHGDDRLVDAVRDGRRREFASFGWSDDVPDAKSGATFLRSKLDWSKLEKPEHRSILALYHDLLSLRRDEPMLRPDGASVDVANGEAGWITILREPALTYDRLGAVDDEGFLTVFNCTGDAVDVPVPGPSLRAWALRLSTDAVDYGGGGRVTETIDAVEPGDAPKRLLQSPESRVARLPAWCGAIFQAVSS